MKDVDEAIGKVMAGLRGVEASAGFEERMQRRVREAARERGASGWFGAWQWASVGCVALLIVGFGMNLRLRGRHDDLATNVGVRRDGRGQTGPDGVGAVQKGVSQRLKTGYGMRGDGTAEAVPLSKAVFLSREAKPGITQAGEWVNDSRDAGSSEIAGLPGAGFPAPPLPLTAQERLLLRVAQAGDPVPVAVFEVSALPTQDAEETAEFMEFFGQDRQVEQSTPGESE